MTAEQMEELLRRAESHDAGWYDAGWYDAQSELILLAPSLARRVLAAEKLVEAGRVMANALKGDYIVPGSARAWDDAEAAYREAGK